MENAFLVILPGWGGSHETWQQFIELAKADFSEVICLDLPCFGSSPCPNEVWGVEEYAEYVKTRISKLPNRPIILLGHSFGGQVATYLVANNPNLCEKLILSGAAVYRRKRGLKELLFWGLAKFGKILFQIPFLKPLQEKAKKILYKAADSPDYNETQGIQRQIFQKVIRQDVSYCIPQIQVPTLVLWGEKDTYVPLSYGRKIAALIPTSTLKIFPDAGHGLHLQKPEEVLNTIQEFIKE